MGHSTALYAVDLDKLKSALSFKVEGGKELSGVKVERADEKSLFEIARELSARATRMKSGDDPEFATTKKNIAAMPRLRFLMCQDTAAGNDGFVFEGVNQGGAGFGDNLRAGDLARSVIRFAKNNARTVTFDGPNFRLGGI